MSTRIVVNEVNGEILYRFNVEVVEGKSSTKHQVTMTEDFYQNFEAEVDPSEIIKKSFEFLLEREPKEIIYAEFDVSVISRYFPEYIEVLKSQL